MEEKLLQDPLTASETDDEHNSCSRRDVILNVSEYRHLAGQDASVNLNGGHNCNRSPKVESHQDKRPFPLLSADSSPCLFALSIFSVVCFCPIGIFAVVTASKLLKARKEGNESNVETLTVRTRALVSLSLGVGIVTIVFCLIIYFVNIFGIRTYFSWKPFCFTMLHIWMNVVMCKYIDIVEWVIKLCWHNDMC